MPLHLFLAAILSGSLALGPGLYTMVAYFNLLTHVQPRRKRLFIAIVAAVIGIICWELSALLGFITVVPTLPTIVDACWTYGVLMGVSAFTSSQLIHGAKQL